MTLQAQLRTEGKEVSIRKVCSILGIARSTTYYFTREGWCHLVAIIDTYDRSIVGRRLSQSGSAQIAVAAFEDALKARAIDPNDNELTLRSDNGLVFGAKAFTQISRRCKVTREYITPHTPEHNGMIERFFRTAKEELFWHYNLEDNDDAFRRFAEWIDYYHEQRPHSALGYQTPSEFRRQMAA